MKPLIFPFTTVLLQYLNVKEDGFKKAIAFRTPLLPLEIKGENIKTKQTITSSISSFTNKFYILLQEYKERLSIELSTLPPEGRSIVLSSLIEKLDIIIFQ